MTIKLSSLRRMTNDLAPVVLIYGPAGMGKTSTALENPDHAYLQIHPERPPVGIEANSFGELSTYAQVVEALGALYQEQHSFRSVVIDSLDALEALVWAETCKRMNWKDLEEPGYGKGYKASDYVWREFIAGCDALRRDKGLTIVWLALAEATNHEDPGKPPYKKYELRLHDRGEKLLTQAADAVLFVNMKVTIQETDTGFNRKVAHADGGGTRWMFCDGRPAFVAKNRFNMPDAVVLPKGRAWAELSKYLPGQAAVAPVAAVEMTGDPEPEAEPAAA